MAKKQVVRKQRRRKAIIKKRKKQARMFLVCAFVFLTISLVIYSIGIFFKIREIEITGLEKYNHSDVVESITLKYGDSLIFMDKNLIIDEILINYPYIDTVKVNRAYPDCLKIQVQESENYATIYFEGEHYVLNDKFKVMSAIFRYEAIKLPKIIGFELENIEIAQIITSQNAYKYQCLVDVFEIFEEYGYADLITEIDLTKNYDIIIKCGTKYQIEIGNTENLDYKMRMFEEVLRKITPSDTVVIDVSDSVYTRFRTEIISPSVYP